MQSKREQIHSPKHIMIIIPIRKKATCKKCDFLIYLFPSQTQTLYHHNFTNRRIIPINHNQFILSLLFDRDDEDSGDRNKNRRISTLMTYFRRLSRYNCSRKIFTRRCFSRPPPWDSWLMVARFLLPTFHPLRESVSFHHARCV